MTIIPKIILWLQIVSGLAVIVVCARIAILCWRDIKELEASQKESDELLEKLDRMEHGDEPNLRLVEPGDTPAAIEDQARESRRWWRKHF